MTPDGFTGQVSKELEMQIQILLTFIINGPTHKFFPSSLNFEGW